MFPFNFPFGWALAGARLRASRVGPGQASAAIDPDYIGWLEKQAGEGGFRCPGRLARLGVVAAREAVARAARRQR